MSETEDFGSYLKHERELRGVALEDIADQTKIHLKYLEALENNLYDHLPGEVFVKGYIRSYAKSIGSNVEEVINAYDDSVGRERRQLLEDEYSGQIKKKSAMRPVIGLAVFVVILAGLVYGGMFFFQAQQKTSTPTPVVMNPKPVSAEPAPQENSPEDEKNIAPEPAAEPTPKPAGDQQQRAGFSENFGTPKDEKAPPKEAVPPAKELAAELPKSKKTSTEDEKEVIIQSVAVSAKATEENKPAAAAAEPAPPLVLKIQAKENAWFNLTVDDYREEDFILSGGLEKTFSGKEKFRITIGNKTSTHLYLNGKPVVLPEVSGEVVRDFIINSSLLE